MKQPIKVLVIEDDPWFAEQFLRVLSGAGFSVRHASDGITGIEMLDKELPDVLLLDVFLPGPNALVLLHEMQSYTDLSKVPVIICSSGAFDVLSASIPYGVAEVLDKEHMQPSDLVAAVRKALL